jgi:hypothetical protein
VTSNQPDEGFFDDWPPDYVFEAEFAEAHPVPTPGRRPRQLPYLVAAPTQSDEEQEKAEDDELEEFIFAGKAVLSDEEVEARVKECMGARPLFLTDLRTALGSGYERPRPTIGQIVGTDNCLLFKGMSHSVSGEGGKGKSIFAMKTAFDYAEAGHRILYLDYEKSWASFVNRARMLGVSSEAADNIAYWGRPGKMMGRKLRRLLRFCLKYGIELVVIDSMSRSMTSCHAGWSENSNDDAREWYEFCIAPMVAAGLTTLTIDHVGRPRDDGPAAAKRYAKGAVDKLNVIDGIVYSAVTGKAFSANHAGWLDIIAGKCNEGHYAEGELVCQFHVTPEDDGERVVAEFRAPKEPSRDANGKIRLTGIMEKISVALSEGPLNQQQLILTVGSKEKSVTDAAKTLQAEGHITVERVSRALMYTLVSEYWQAQDPASDRYDPSAAQAHF